MNNAYIRLMIYLYRAEKSSVDVELAKVLLNAYEYFPDILIEDIARSANTTPASVSKFAHKLGYKSFKELRYDCIQGENLQIINKQLSIAENDYQEGCEYYLNEKQANLSFYMQYHDQTMIQEVAKLLNNQKEIGIYYTHYSYPCVHVLRNYLSPLHIQVQGVLRDLDDDFMSQRLKECNIIWIISLQGTWIIDRLAWLKKLKKQGKQFIIITAVYDIRFKELTAYIFPFQFSATILDTATQISCLFVKVAFAYVHFLKLEKSESIQL